MLETEANRLESQVQTLAEEVDRTTLTLTRTRTRTRTAEEVDRTTLTLTLILPLPLNFTLCPDGRSKHRRWSSEQQSNAHESSRTREGPSPSRWRSNQRYTYKSCPYCSPYPNP